MTNKKIIRVLLIKTFLFINSILFLNASPNYSSYYSKNYDNKNKK